MKAIEFNCANSVYSFNGKLRSLFLHKVEELVLEKDGKPYFFYNHRSPTKLNLVFKGYPQGDYSIHGVGSGVVYLMEPEDTDFFDEKLHQSILGY